MKAVAGLRTLHPTVAGEEGATATQREAVGAVLAQEHALRHRAQRHRGRRRRAQRRRTRQGGVVGDQRVGRAGRVGRQPFQLAVAAQRVR